MLLDVLPELLGQFRAGQRLRADYYRKFLVGLDRLQECGIGFPFSGHGVFSCCVWMDQSVLLVGFRLPRLYRHLDPDVIPIPDRFQQTWIMVSFRTPARG